MMKLQRLLILFTLLTLLEIPPTHAIPQERLYGNTPRAGFIKNYFLRMLRWQTENSKQWSLFLNNDEKVLINDWTDQLRDWGYRLDDQHSFPRFYFEHKWMNGKMEKTSLCITLNNWPLELKNRALNVLKKRRVRLKNELLPAFYGMAWHPETQTTEVFYLHTPQNPLPQDHVDLSLTSDSQKWLPQKLYSEIYDSQGVKTESKMISALLRVDWSLLPKTSLDVFSAQKIESTHAPAQWKLDLRSIPPSLLAPSIAETAKQMSKNFLLTPDSIIYVNTLNQTVFYP